MKIDRHLLAALLLSLSLCSCSSSSVSDRTATSKSSEMTGAKILGFVQGTLKWSELSPDEQQLYTKIYKRELPAEEQATWDKLLRPAARPASDNTASAPQTIASADSGKPSGPPPKPAANKTGSVSRPSDTELQDAAIHIRQAWHNQLPVDALTPFEKQTYAQIYKRKLPADRLKSWDSFLKQPSDPPHIIPVELRGAIMPTAAPAGKTH